MPIKESRSLYTRHWWVSDASNQQTVGFILSVQNEWNCLKVVCCTTTVIVSFFAHLLL